MWWFRLIVTALFFLMPVLANAACFGGNVTMGYPAPSCWEPNIPFCLLSKDCDSYELDRFKRDLDDYSECIDRYTRNVDEDIRCAQEQRNTAIRKFNDFVEDVKRRAR
jgi:hypothetical protein